MNSPWVLHPWIGSTKKNKSVEPVSTWQSISEMTRLGLEATIIRLHTFIFLCRNNPWIKYPRNSILFFNFERILYWYEIKAYFLNNLFLSYFILLFLISLFSWTEICSWINNYEDYGRRRSNMIRACYLM